MAPPILNPGVYRVRNKSSASFMECFGAAFEEEGEVCGYQDRKQWAGINTVQRWSLTIVPNSDNLHYYVQNMANGKFLTLQPGGHDTPVVTCSQKYCLRSDRNPSWQHWTVTNPDEATSFVLYNVGFGVVLDLARGDAANRTTILGYNMNGTGSDNQRWAFMPDLV